MNIVRYRAKQQAGYRIAIKHREVLSKMEAALLERFGMVLYWLGSGLAAISIICGILIFATSDRSALELTIGVFGGGAIVLYLLGRACRYIFAAR